MTSIPTTQLEARLRGVTKKHDKNGPWCQVTFEVREDELNKASLLWGSDLGTRWQLVAVEINDDETPKGEKPKKRFDEMSRAQQAGVLCADTDFCMWLQQRQPYPRDVMMHPEPEAEFVRQYCEVKSRKELDEHPYPANRWDSLVTEYRQATGQLAENRS